MPLKEWMAVSILYSTSEGKHSWSQLFLEINMLLLKNCSSKQCMTARSPVKINILSFGEWTTATLSVTKTDTLLQRKDDCNKKSEIHKLSLKISNAQNSSFKKVAILSK